MIQLETTADGIVLPVRAQPGARKDALRCWHAGQLKVCVTAAPEKGKANQAIVAVLCECLGLRKSQLELISGQTAASKRFLVREMTADELRQRIELALAGGE